MVISPVEYFYLVTNCFYRTIAANDNFVVAVAHDGKGHNTLYVYDPALNLLASRKVLIKKKDFSFNMSSLLSLDAYLHKIELVMRGPKLLIFTISQKYEYKLFVFEYFQGELTTLKKYRNVHTSKLIL